MNRQSFLLGVSLTCLITMLFAPSILSNRLKTLEKIGFMSNKNYLTTKKLITIF